MKWILMTLSVVLITSSSWSLAQDRPPDPPAGKAPRHGDGGKDWRNGRGDMKKRFAAALKRLKKTDPEKYDELQKLRETDFYNYMRELRMIVHPECNAPEVGKGKGKGKGKGRHGGRRFGGPGGERGGKRFSERFLEHMKTHDPERFARIQALRKENPEAAKKELVKIFSSFRKKHFKRDERISKIITMYRSAGDDAGREVQKQKLITIIFESFDKRMRMKEDEINHLKKRIVTMEERLNTYRSSRDSICQKRLQELLDSERPERSERPSDNEQPTRKHGE